MAPRLAACLAAAAVLLAASAHAAAARRVLATVPWAARGGVDVVGPTGAKGALAPGGQLLINWDLLDKGCAPGARGGGPRGGAVPGAAWEGAAWGRGGPGAAPLLQPTRAHAAAPSSATPPTQRRRRRRARRVPRVERVGRRHRARAVRAAL
jgi:hypothetical protein